MTSTQRSISLLVLFAIALGCASSADAQRRRRRVSPEEERARELYQRGDEEYANGHYDEAIAAFQEAYDLSARPLLLYNLANAQERAGYLDQAMTSLERYLPDASADEREEVENRISSIRERLEQQRAEEEAAAAAAAEAEAEAAAASESATPEVSRAGPDLVPAIALLATGGALLVGAVVTGVLALSARDQAAASCSGGEGPTLCTTEAAGPLDDDLALSVTTDVLGGLGIVALGVGVYFLVDALSDQSSESVEAAFVVDPRGAAMGIARARF